MRGASRVPGSIRLREWAPDFFRASPGTAPPLAERGPDRGRL